MTEKKQQQKNIDLKKNGAPHQYIRMISYGSCDAKDWV